MVIVVMVMIVTVTMVVFMFMIMAMIMCRQASVVKVCFMVSGILGFRVFIECTSCNSFLCPLLLLLPSPFRKLFCAVMCFRVHIGGDKKLLFFIFLRGLL